MPIVGRPIAVTSHQICAAVVSQLALSITDAYEELQLACYVQSAQAGDDIASVRSWRAIGKLLPLPSETGNLDLKW